MVTLRQLMYVPPRWRGGAEQDEKTFNVGRNNNGDLGLGFTYEVIKRSQGKEERGKIIGKKVRNPFPVTLLISVFRPTFEKKNFTEKLTPRFNNQ